MPKVVIKSLPSFKSAGGSSFNILDRALEEADLTIKVSPDSPYALRQAADRIKSSLHGADDEKQKYDALQKIETYLNSAQKMEMLSGGDISVDNLFNSIKQDAKTAGLRDPELYLSSVLSGVKHQEALISQELNLLTINGASLARVTDTQQMLSDLKQKEDFYSDALASSKKGVGGYDMYYKLGANGKVLDWDIANSGMKPEGFSGDYGRIDGADMNGFNVFLPVRKDQSVINFAGVTLTQKPGTELGGFKDFTFSVEPGSKGGFDATQIYGNSPSGAKPGDLFYGVNNPDNLYYRTNSNTWAQMPKETANKLGIDWALDATPLADYQISEIDSKKSNIVDLTKVKDVNDFNQLMNAPTTESINTGMMSSLSYALSGKEGPILPLNPVEQDLAQNNPAIRERLIEGGGASRVGLEAVPNQSGGQDLRKTPQTNQQTKKPAKFNLFNPASWFNK